jgi:hypothetical protein
MARARSSSLQSLFVGVLLLASFFTTTELSGDPPPSAPREAGRLTFERNLGQAGRDVRFLARGSGYRSPGGFASGNSAVASNASAVIVGRQT